MEDRYLFKAKKKNWQELSKDEQWVTGTIMYIENKCMMLIEDEENLLRVHYIDDEMWTTEIYAIEVDPSTICQCTGLKDKNGNLIWENDIVKCLYNCYGEKFVYIGKMIYKEDTCRFVAVNSESTDYEWWDEEKEVIGNIFDNPELLNKR